VGGKIKEPQSRKDSKKKKNNENLQKPVREKTRMNVVDEGRLGDVLGLGKVGGFSVKKLSGRGHTPTIYQKKPVGGTTKETSNSKTISEKLGGGKQQGQTREKA